MMPYCLEVGTAPSGVSLDVVGKIEKMDVVVILDMSHPLNLSLRFLKEFQAQLDYSGDQPSIQIQGEQIPIETNMEILETEQYPGGEESPGEQESRGLEGLEEQMEQVDLAEQGAIAAAGKGFLPPFR